MLDKCQLNDVKRNETFLLKPAPYLSRFTVATGKSFPYRAAPNAVECFISLKSDFLVILK